MATAVIAGEKDVNFGGVYENFVAQELAAAQVALHYHRHSGRGEVDFLGETAERKVVPIEVKSGKAYKRHVALNNLLSVDDFGVDEAYVLSEANISEGLRSGKPVHYVPLYLAPFLTSGLVAKGIDADDELERLGVTSEGLFFPPPDFSDFA